MTLHELEKILMNISIDASTVGNAQYNMIVGSTMTMLKSVENLAATVLQGPLNDSCKQMMMQKMVDLEMHTSNAILMRLAELGIDVYLYTGLDEINSSGRVPVMPQQPMMMQQPMVMMQPQMMAQPMMQQPMMAPQPMMQPAMPQPMQQPVAPAAPPPAAAPPPPPPPAAAPPPPAAPPPAAAPAEPPPPPPPAKESAKESAKKAPEEAPKEVAPKPEAAEPVAAEPEAPPPPPPPSSGGGGIGLPGAGSSSEEAVGPAYLLKIINGEE